ncbi:MAG: hypothetical protein ABL984_17075 [Pyrinomonadaceae bacterium]
MMHYSHHIGERRLLHFAGGETPGGKQEAVHPVVETSINVIKEQMNPQGLNELAHRTAAASIERGADFIGKQKDRLRSNDTLRGKATGALKDGLQAGIRTTADVAKPYVAEVGAREGRRQGQNIPVIGGSITGGIGESKGREMGAASVDAAGTMAEKAANSAIDATGNTIDSAKKGIGRFFGRR